MNKKVCGVDFDETLFSTLNAWGQAYVDMTGEPFNRPSRYDFSDVMDEEQRKLFWSARTPKVYDSPLIEPYDDAVWLVDWLLDHGWDIVIVTTDTEPFVARKAKLLARHYPRLAGAPIVLAKDKWAAVPGMAMLIDDNPGSNATVYLAESYNQDVPAEKRFEDLRDVPRRLDLAGWRTDEYLKTVTCPPNDGPWGAFKAVEVDEAWNRHGPKKPRGPASVNWDLSAWLGKKFGCYVEVAFFVDGRYEIRTEHADFWLVDESVRQYLGTAKPMPPLWLSEPET